MSIFQFAVVGDPVPKGSSTGFVVRSKKTGRNRAVVTASNRATLRPWEAMVKDAARQAGVRTALKETAVRIELQFHMKRPKGHQRKSGGLVKGAPMAPAVKPDLDKLARAVLDGLTYVAFEDDAQVVMLKAARQYCRDGEQPGVTVWIWWLAETE